MKANTIKKVVNDKVLDWMSTLPLEIQEYIGSKIVVTGGCIASMFLKEKVNDFDIYFKNIKAVLMISQHYCNKWIVDNEKQSSKVSSGIVPMLRLTLNGEMGEEKFSTLCKVFTHEASNFQYKPNSSGEKRIIIHPQDEGLKTLLQEQNYWNQVVRCEIFIQSQGFLGENPDEEYDYFEGRETEAAEDFIDKTLLTNEEGLNEKAEKYSTVFMSTNAITLSHKIQLVIRFFGDPSKIHDTYDFIHATNYWTKKEGLVTNTKALESLLSKELIYSGSKYPLASIFRTRKFLKREWTCHVGNYVKMAMQLNDMDLTDPFVLEEQLTGVDAAYLYQIIRAVKDKRKDDPTFQFNSTYICTLVDRMMGVSGQESEDTIDGELIENNY
jgi:hypothetical protein